MVKLTQKQGILRVLQRLEEINTTINECEESLNKLKPIDFYQNEVSEILKQILKNQHQISKTLNYVAKYVKNKEKI